MKRGLSSLSALAGAALLALATGCSDSAEPDDDGASVSAGAGGASSSVGNGTGGSGVGGSMDVCGPDPSAPNEDLGAGPFAGPFSLEEALDGLPEGSGALRAVFTTPAGDITCELFEQAVPTAVANFVGLARGVRPWKDPSAGTWVKRRFYDGLTFHRIIDDFMIQGGDPLGNGTGDPGYKWNDEFAGLMHQPGTLAYANSGPNSNGSQFYITEIRTDWLDGGYTIFGQCSPMETIAELAKTPTGAGDKPLSPVVMSKVEITRCP